MSAGCGWALFHLVLFLVWVGIGFVGASLLRGGK